MYKFLHVQELQLITFSGDQQGITTSTDNMAWAEITTSTDNMAWAEVHLTTACCIYTPQLSAIGFTIQLSVVVTICLHDKPLPPPSSHLPYDKPTLPLLLSPSPMMWENSSDLSIVKPHHSRSIPVKRQEESARENTRVGRSVASQGYGS